MVIGGLTDYLLNITTGWLNTTAGVIVGVLISAIIYILQIRKSPQDNEQYPMRCQNKQLRNLKFNHPLFLAGPEQYRSG